MRVSSGYPPTQRAGLEYGCQRLSEGLARRGYAVTVITSYANGLFVLSAHSRRLPMAATVEASGLWTALTGEVS